MKYALLLVLLVGPAHGAEFSKEQAAVLDGMYPDKALTPGVINPALTKDVICSPNFRTGDYRHVTLKMHEQVWASYGMDWKTDHSCCEDDHFIPIELGGANDNANRWPEPWVDAHKKDEVENYLKRQVCKEGLPLAEAQREISTYWMAVWREIR